MQLTIVLDIFHVLEYLWKAGHALAAEGSDELEQWVLQLPAEVPGLETIFGTVEVGRTGYGPAGDGDEVDVVLHHRSQ